MDAPNDSGMVVGVFADRPRAEAAAEALGRAGFPLQTVELVAPDLVDARLLAELAEGDAAWREELGRTEDTLVIVSGARGDDARPILVEYGAQEIVADDDLDRPPNRRDAVPVRGRDEVSPPAPQVRPGMPVVGSDLAPVGRLKQVRDGELLLDRRPARRDIWLPLHTVDRLIGTWVVLTLPAAQVDPIEPFVRPRIGERSATPGPVVGEEPV